MMKTVLSEISNLKKKSFKAAYFDHLKDTFIQFSFSENMPSRAYRIF